MALSLASFALRGHARLRFVLAAVAGIRDFGLFCLCAASAIAVRFAFARASASAVRFAFARASAIAVCFAFARASAIAVCFAFARHPQWRFVLPLRGHPRLRLAAQALPLCGAAPTFFAAAKKVGK
ncbi:hypothetical protein J8I87_44180, partial [Paraburkholderia sp. LEh10]|uniref:hypothetical protein n=1 Tax=Paraburkholderia sp. LEh10 TaxID=2821353 RepID=UPI001AEA2DD7